VDLALRPRRGRDHGRRGDGLQPIQDRLYETLFQQGKVLENF
jgi:hypothetical protein